jgi:DNA-binding response OmpR family regulator
MPRMSGAELHRRLAARWPCLPVLFISGHPRDAFGPGVLPPAGAPLIAKPFAPVELAAAVRAALDRVKALAG